jgi:hypothetical protein
MDQDLEAYDDDEDKIRMNEIKEGKNLKIQREN